MKIVLLLTKDDINTNIVGHHIEITTSDGTSINLNPEAFKELYSDLGKAIDILDPFNPSEPFATT